MPFSAIVLRQSGRTVVGLAGELDLASQGLAVGVVHGVLNAGSAPIILDLADLAFIDTTGADAVLRMQRMAAQASVDFAVANASLDTDQVLQFRGYLQPGGVWDGPACSGEVRLRRRAVLGRAARTMRYYGLRRRWATTGRDT